MGLRRVAQCWWWHADGLLGVGHRRASEGLLEDQNGGGGKGVGPDLKVCVFFLDELK